MHILRSYVHVGEKAELIPIDQAKIFCPSDLLILPSCFPPFFFPDSFITFTWAAFQETLIQGPVFFPDTVQSHATVSAFLKV